MAISAFAGHGKLGLCTEHMVRRDRVVQEIFVGSMRELTEDIFGSHGLPIQVHMYAILIYYYCDGKCH